MTESDIHKLVKIGIAQALQENGFTVRTEYNGIKEEGVIDVYAEKPDGELVKVEVVNTHIPNWLLIRLDGNSISLRRPKTDKIIFRQIKIKASTYRRLREMMRPGDTFDSVINRIFDCRTELRHLKEIEKDKDTVI